MKLFSFYKGLSWLLMLNVLIKPLWVFGIDRVVQNRVGYQVYGIYFSQLALCISLGFLADVGLAGLVNRELANGATLHVKSLLHLKIFFSFIYVAVISLVAFATGVQNWHLLILVIIIQVLGSYLLFFRAIISAQQLFKKDAWISVIDKSLVIICAGFILYTSLSAWLTLPLFLYMQIGALAIALGVAGVVVFGQKSSGVIEKKTALLLRALPFMLLMLLMSAHNRIDAFLLGRFGVDGAYQAGIYASAYRLLDAANILGFLVASFLVPFAARNLSDKKMISGVSITLRQGLLFTSFILLAFVFVYAGQIRSWLYPSLAEYNPNILVFCMAALPAIYLTHIYGSLLTAQGELRTFSFIVAGALVINVALNFSLMYKGALGSCIAALISQSFCAIGCILVCKRKMGIVIKPWSISMVAGLGVLYWGLFYMGAQTNFSVIVWVGVAAVLTALLMFAWWRRHKNALSFN